MKRETLERQVGPWVEGERFWDLRDGLAADWPPKGDALLAELAAGEQPIVLLIDELPVLVNRLLKGDEGFIPAVRR